MFGKESIQLLYISLGDYFVENKVVYNHNQVLGGNVMHKTFQAALHLHLGGTVLLVVQEKHQFLAFPVTAHQYLGRNVSADLRVLAYIT